MAIYVGDLITEVRRDTDNVDFTVDSSGNLTEGISTEDFLRYMNFGLMRLQGLILQRNTKLFEKQTDFSVTADQAQYTISDNVYLKESIVDVQYSPTGQESDFREIREISESYRSYDSGGHIVAYSRRAGSIFVTPVPSTTQGTLRVKYNRALDKLDLRRGKIDAITIAGGAITADTISLDTTDDDPTRISGVTDQYFTIVDKDGVVQAYNVPYTAYDDATGNFTHPAYTLGTGETGAVDDYITIGKYVTTHLADLDSPDVERYLQLYAMVKIFRRDSSSDSIEAGRELAAVETDIIDSYSSVVKDEGDIQIDDPGLLFLDRWE